MYISTFKETIYVSLPFYSSPIIYPYVFVTGGLQFLMGISLGFVCEFGGEGRGGLWETGMNKWKQ